MSRGSNVLSIKLIRIWRSLYGRGCVGCAFWYKRYRYLCRSTPLDSTPMVFRRFLPGKHPSSRKHADLAWLPALLLRQAPQPAIAGCPLFAERTNTHLTIVGGGGMRRGVFIQHGTSRLCPMRVSDHHDERPQVSRCANKFKPGSRVAEKAPVRQFKRDPFRAPPYPRACEKLRCSCSNMPETHSKKKNISPYQYSYLFIQIMLFYLH